MFAFIRLPGFCKSLRSAVLVLLLAVSPMAGAIYNHNVTGRVLFTAVYADGDYLFPVG
jgi:hypothetical protein